MVSDESLDCQIETVQSKLDGILNALSASAVSVDAGMAQVGPQMTELLATLKAISAIQQQQQFLVTVGQSLRRSLNAQDVANQTVVAVQQLLPVDGVVVYRFQRNGTAVVAASNELLAAQAELGAEQSKTLLQACLSREIVADSSSWTTLPPALQPLIQLQPQAVALIAVPIQQETRLLGAIVALQCPEQRPEQRLEQYQWTVQYTALLQRLSTEVAIALQHSELYQQAQQHNVNLERQVQYRTEQLKNALDYESMLKRITERVRDSLDERAIIEVAVQELTLVLDIAGCNAALYDLDRGTSTIHYEYTQSIPTSQGRVAQMENFPEIYQQLQRGWAFQFCSLLPNPVRGRVTLLACPIFVDPQSSRGVDQAVMGDLWLIHHPDCTFDEHELRLVQQVASQCAIAIRQARLYQAAQVQVQELAELNRLKDEFLSTVSHELRTPITNIKMAIRMLRNANTEDRRGQYLDILEQEAVREANLINDLLDLQQLQAVPQPLESETLVLRDWLLQVIDPFQPRFAARQQNFQLHGADLLPAIATEPASLQRILTELLNNACKYTAPQQQISLTVALEQSSVELHPDSGWVVFEVRNQALIPVTELPKIFDKFYRCPNADPWKQGGTGLGLALVKKLVERLQGELQVTSANGWTQFTVKLPVPLDWTISSEGNAAIC